MSKVLILSSSPQRDKLIDVLLKRKLEALNNEVTIGSLPTGAREAILEIKPDILITPPIKNFFGFNLMDEASHFGIATVVRHIEPSCDAKDLEVMDEHWKKVLLHNRPPTLSVELMWGMPEAEYIVEKIKPKYPIIVVGAFVADVYKDKDLQKDIINHSDFIKKHNLKPSHQTILLSSPWGLLDMDADILGESSSVWEKDNEAKRAWLKMAEDLASEVGERYNILATLHPAVSPDDYIPTLTKSGIGIDYRSPSLELLSNCDFLVHSGSTMAVEMHWLDKPAFQFGDVNSLDMPDGNWWQRRGCAISRVSPFYLDGHNIAQAIKSSDGKGNANIEAIKELESGRYGTMDGKATDRAASVINQLKGKFQTKWPRPRVDLSGLICTRQPERYLTKITCQVCSNDFWFVRKDWLEAIFEAAKASAQIDLLKLKVVCPFCGYPLRIKSKQIKIQEK